MNETVYRRFIIREPPWTAVIGPISAQLAESVKFGKRSLLKFLIAAVFGIATLNHWLGLDFALLA